MSILPDYVLQEVFTYVYHEIPLKLSWRNVNLTCKYWHQLAHPLLKKIDILQAFSASLRRPYACNGVIDSQLNVQLMSDCGLVQFPSKQNETNYLEDLIAKCYKNQNATYVSLKPPSFMTSFHPNEFNINTDIQKTFGYTDNFCCKLNELHVFPPASTSQTLHVETIENSERASYIGSLVVLLPYPHTGGNRLTLKKGVRAKSYDFTDTGPNVKWIAFKKRWTLSIDPITAGYLIFLHYYVFEITRRDITVAITQEPSYSILKEIVAQKEQVCGERFGYPLKYKYSNADLIWAEISPELALAGDDRMVFLNATSLGLKTKLRAVLWPSGRDVPESEEERAQLLVLKCMPKNKFLTSAFYTDDILEREFNSTLINTNEIRWLRQPPNFFPNIAGITAMHSDGTAGDYVAFFKAVLFLSVDDPSTRELAKKKREEIKRRRKKNEPMDVQP